MKRFLTWLFGPVCDACGRRSHTVQTYSWRIWISTEDYDLDSLDLCLKCAVGDPATRDAELR